MSELTFDDKGKVPARKAAENTGPEMESGPLSRSRMQGPLNPATVARMQQTVGNQAVQRALLQRSGGEGSAELDEDTSSAIQNARGGGQSLDEGIAGKAGSTMGTDFSDVRVHADSQAAELSNQVNAKAFTIGNDIFFNEGQYSPASSGGQELISHELTHVVQQGGGTPGVQGKLSVNDPNDQYEKEADAVAQQVMSKEDDSAAVQRQDMPEEEELQAKRLDVLRQEEEELLQGKRQDVQRQEEEELELKPLDVQRQEEEEELAMPKRMDVQRAEEADDCC